MVDFGFSLNKSSCIDLDKADSSLFKMIALEEPDILRCMACGSCTATCSAGRFSQISFRKVILLLERGETADAVEQIKKCMLCGKCTLVCPRGINTRHIISLILNHYKK